MTTLRWLRLTQWGAILVLLLSSLSMLGLHELRSRLHRLQIHGATLNLELEGESPSGQLELQGHNPLPLALQVELCSVWVNGKGLPIPLTMTPQGQVELPPGDFQAVLPLRATGPQLLLASLTGLLATTGLVELQTELRAGVGPLRQNYTLRTALQH